MQNEESGILADIMFLYELSSNTGQSLDTFQNCDVFLKTIVSHKSLTHAYLYFHISQLGFPVGTTADSLVMFHGIPGHSPLKSEYSNQESFLQPFTTQEYYTVSDHNEELAKLGPGTISIVSMPNVGILILHSSMVNDKKISGYRLTQLSRACIQFKNSIEGCLAHQQLKEEMIERKRNGQILEKQNVELKKLNKEMDLFVYSASHDLRAPLLSVKGLVSIIENTSDEGERDICIAHIKKSITRLDEFVSEIIDLSKNSRVEVQFKAINFNEIIGDIITDLKYMVNQDEMEITYLCGDFNPYFSDEYRIKVILNNIISNAIKYKASNGHRHKVNILVQAQENELLISIKDNGIGIGQEHLDKVFNMFYRATVEKVGSGLGLYIAKEMVEKLNGEIKIESTLQKGTSIEIRFPIQLNQVVEI